MTNCGLKKNVIPFYWTLTRRNQNSKGISLGFGALFHISQKCCENAGKSNYGDKRVTIRVN